MWHRIVIQAVRTESMEVIRDIQMVKDGEINLQLPPHFLGREGEVIVLPAHHLSISSSPKRSLRGSLKDFDNPDNWGTKRDSIEQLPTFYHACPITRNFDVYITVCLLDEPSYGLPSARSLHRCISAS